MHVDLAQLGYSPALAFYLEELGDSLVAARVSRVDRGACRVLTVEGERPATLAGSLQMVDEHDLEGLAVGDWVACEAEHDALVVRAVLPRRSLFARSRHSGAAAHQLLAANIDIVFLVMGLDNDFSVRRVERYLTLLRASGDIRAAIVLNKCDLHDDIRAFEQQISSVAPRIELLAVSALRGEGLDGLRAQLGPGVTGAFFGSSGVGKSTVINRLLGEERLATSAVREHDDRGKHTTTARTLMLLPKGGVVIDTPGLREVGVLGDEHDLEQVFAEIADLAAECRFADCQHLEEPGCAVRTALEEGTIDPDRLESFLTLRQEQKSAARRQASHEQRAYEKATYGRYRKDLREIYKKKGRE